MAQLNVSIDIPEEDFKGYIVNELRDLPKDKMQELLLKAVEIALVNDKDKRSNSLFIEDGSWSHGPEPTKLFKDVLKELPTDEYLNPIVEEVSNFIKENYKNFIHYYIVEAFTRILFTEASQFEFKKEIMNSIRGQMPF